MDAPANTAKRSPATGRSWGACRMYVVGINSDRLGCRLDGCPALQPICECPWLFQGLPDPQQKQHHLGKAAPDARHDSVGTQSDACPCWLARSDFVSGVVGVALSRSADCALLLRVHHCSVGKLHEVSTTTQSCRWPVLESGGTSCAFASGRAVFWSHKRKEVAPLDLFQALERACRSARLADSATPENASKSPGSFARDCSAMDVPANTAKRSPATGRSWGAAGCTSYARTPTAQDVGWMDVRRCNQSANVLGFSKVSLIRSRNNTACCPSTIR